MESRSRSASPPPSPRPEPERLRSIIKDVIVWFVQEMRESGSANILEKEIIDPLLKGVLNKLIPYIVTSSIVFLVVIVGVIVGAAWLLPKILNTSAGYTVSVPNA
jgi:hypothetical protein